MSSLILTINPQRRILEASPDLAGSVGSAPRFMIGSDCAGILRCRNADGEPLCRGFCPALRAARNRSRIVEGVPIWLESPRDGLKRFEATFQSIASVPRGMVVAFFGDPCGKQAGSPQASSEERVLEPCSGARSASQKPGSPLAFLARRLGKRPKLKLVTG